MSTRCQVIIYKDGEPVQNLYHHCDGYPSYMGHFLYRAGKLSNMMSRTVHDTVDKLNLIMDIEGQFEELAIDEFHLDVEYLWYVCVDGEDVEIRYIDLCKTDCSGCPDGTPVYAYLYDAGTGLTTYRLGE